ncbi:hypothetical protein EDB82DRAFT_92378 [Fusarium venenatum]|uniref:uncharacterized protein n=1 Tax=Fusarium venenatum TaxID=56646 RepID=UPI001E0E69F8|nr:hypothetical protein EDB82DRAFT_92378 [Fusarium venenatum]
MTSTVVLCLMFGFGTQYTSTDITGNESTFCNVVRDRDPFQGQMSRAHRHQNKQTNKKKGCRPASDSGGKSRIGILQGIITPGTRSSIRFPSINDRVCVCCTVWTGQKMGAYLPCLTQLYHFCTMLPKYNSCGESLGLLGQVRIHILALYQNIKVHFRVFQYHVSQLAKTRYSGRMSDMLTEGEAIYMGS